MTWPALNENFLAAAAATFNFRLGLPVPLAITPDGAVLFRRTGPRSFGSDLYLLDTATGAVTTLVTVDQLLGGSNEQLSDAEKARRERTRTATRGIVRISVSRDGKRILIPLGERLFVVDRGTTNQTREIAVGTGFPYDPQLSPDGKQVAFVRDGDLWLVGADAQRAAPRQLTKHPADIEYAVADFAAQEELKRTRGFWWSPDSRSLAFQRTDARKVDTLYVADSRHPDKAPVPFKYPRAGRANAVVDLAVIGIDATPSTTPHWITWDTAKYPYLAEVLWHKGAPLAYTVLDRNQTELALFTVDATTYRSKLLHHEQDSTWINANGGVQQFLDDGGFLWMTEASGQWVLERYAADGTRHGILTDASLGLRSVIGVNEKADVVYVTASADPRQSHVYQIPLTGIRPPVRFPGPPVAITDVAAGGVHSGFADHGVVVVQSALQHGGAQVAAIVGGKTVVLPSVAETPTLTPTTVLEQVQAADDATRSYYTTITRPRDFDPAKKYPVLLKVYAGPHAIMVTDSRDAYLMDQWYADAGFIVVRADGRGTPNRGRDWERAILKDLITVPMHDQVAALQALGKLHPEMDMNRVGVFGWSFGGYFATMALLLHGDLFKAGVAGAPVTDWELYDTAYTERYMKLPADNADGYRRTSALTYAAQLNRPLLMIHGITDDNVHFAHTLALIEALYVAGKRAEVVTLSATHMVPDPKLNLAREKVQVDFFRQHLAATTSVALGKSQP